MQKPRKQRIVQIEFPDEEIAEVLLHTIQMQVVSDEVLRKYIYKRN